MADRNFCTLNFIFGINHRKAFFILRQHANTPCKLLNEKEFIAESETGKVYEQQAILSHEEEEIIVRQVSVELHKATRNGDKELRLFTNLPKSKASALTIANIYSERWSIEIFFRCQVSYCWPRATSLSFQSCRSRDACSMAS